MIEFLYFISGALIIGAIWIYYIQKFKSIFVPLHIQSQIKRIQTKDKSFKKLNDLLWFALDMVEAYMYEPDAIGTYEKEIIGYKRIQNWKDIKIKKEENRQKYVQEWEELRKKYEIE